MNEDAFESIVARAEGRVGSTLKGKWRLERLLGVGGMASVYEATHRNRKRAAVKMLHAELSMNTSVRERFLREGYVANSVGHPGAVAVDDDDVTEDGCAFLVMELLEGETLEARWERKGKRLAADEVLSLVDQVLDTLAAGHEKGIVHRDLKPENLFLTRAGVVKVLDFGIARVRELSQSGSRTQTGSMMGTPAFMPPEQARGRWEEVDGQSDLWAIGATMFTLLTGRYVHEAGTVNEALVLAVTHRAPSLAVFRPDLTFPIVELVDRALAYEKQERWPSAVTMQRAVRRAFAGLQAEAQDNESVKRPITLDQFDEETVVAADGLVAGSSHDGSGVAAPLVLDSEIPAAVRPVVKLGALTTARGVASGVFNQALAGARSRRAVLLAASLFVMALVTAWIGLGPSGERRAVVDPEPPATRLVASGVGGERQPPASTVPEGTTAAEPLVMRLDEIPVASSVPTQSQRPPSKRKEGLEDQPAALRASPYAPATVSESKRNLQNPSVHQPSIETDDDAFNSRR